MNVMLLTDEPVVAVPVVECDVVVVLSQRGNLDSVFALLPHDHRQGVGHLPSEFEFALAHDENALLATLRIDSLATPVHRKADWVPAAIAGGQLGGESRRPRRRRSVVLCPSRRHSIFR